ncbi:MAG: transposase [Chthoniobacterales bacterium]|nr:transposase [Chthoniobacterales bacterium]
MNRGNHGEAIFLDDDDRRKFLVTLGETCTKASWQIHAYCLMSNHFHLVIETPKPTLVIGMKWLLSVYTQRFNAKHKKRGHLFAGRYKSLIIDGSDQSYLRRVCDYVHLNPARAHLLQRGKLLESYPWSSFNHYLQLPHQRAPWLRVDRLLGEHGIENDNASGGKTFSRMMNQRYLLEADETKEDKAIDKIIKRGWRFGTPQFVELLHEKVSFTPNKNIHIAAECNETMEVFGKRLIQKKLSELKMNFKSLERLPKTDPLKIELAELLRSQTTLSLEWIAAQLKAGVRGTLVNSLYKKRRHSKSAILEKKEM